MASAGVTKPRAGDWSPDDLERAAKYLRELDKSANAKVAFELSKREQDVELAREKARGQEADANRVHALNQLERTRGEEQRKVIESKRESEKVRLGGAWWWRWWRQWQLRDGSDVRDD